MKGSDKRLLTVSGMGNGDLWLAIHAHKRHYSFVLPKSEVQRLIGAILATTNGLTNDAIEFEGTTFL